LVCSIKPPGGKSGRDGEASTFLAEGEAEGWAYAEVKKLLENEHIEKYQRINPLATCIALALLSIALFKKWAK
jgi:hypothetical protein